MTSLKSLLTLLILSPGLLSGELTVGSPFTTNGVLQRDQPIPIWGSSDAGSTVTVKFADQIKSATVSPDGRWSLQLDALPASHDPRTLSISDQNNASIEFNNIVVGEVWICSGQSNMQMGYGGIADINALIPTAKNLRTFKVKNTVSFTEEDRCGGQWVEGPPDSAVAFSFAYFSSRKLPGLPSASSKAPGGALRSKHGCHVS